MSPSLRVAVITGASSGIGAALARELAGSGFKVGLIARRIDRLHELAKELGASALVAQADVVDRAQIVAAIRHLAGNLGPIDLLIANAGVGLHTRLDPFNVEQIEHVIRVNLLGVVYSLEAVLPDMLQRRTGHLAAISSLAAFGACRASRLTQQGGRQCFRRLALQLWAAASRDNHLSGFVKSDDGRPSIPHAVSVGHQRCGSPHLPGSNAKRRYSVSGKPPVS